MDSSERVRIWESDDIGSLEPSSTQRITFLVFAAINDAEVRRLSLQSPCLDCSHRLVDILLRQTH